jgi:hypothetical protein
MKKTKQVIEEHPGYAKMIRKIIREVGKKNFEDITRHGANAGFPGITYTADCMALAWSVRKEIIKLLEEYSEEYGTDIGHMMQEWQGVGKDYKINEIYKAVYLTRTPSFENDTERTVWDVLAKFAAEEVSRWFCDE